MKNTFYYKHRTAIACIAFIIFLAVLIMHLLTLVIDQLTQTAPC